MLDDQDLEHVAGGFCATPVLKPLPRIGLPTIPGFPPRPPICIFTLPIKAERYDAASDK